MDRTLKTAFATLVLVGLFGLFEARATEVAIDNPMWSKLPTDEQESIKQRLRQQGVLGANDVIVTKGQTEQDVEELDVGLARILLDICIAKHVAELKNCAQLQGDAQTVCRQEEDRRTERAKEVCKQAM